MRITAVLLLPLPLDCCPRRTAPVHGVPLCSNGRRRLDRLNDHRTRFPGGAAIRRSEAELTFQHRRLRNAAVWPGSELCTTDQCSDGHYHLRPTRLQAGSWHDCRAERRRNYVHLAGRIERAIAREVYHPRWPASGERTCRTCERRRLAGAGPRPDSGVSGDNRKASPLLNAAELHEETWHRYSRGRSEAEVEHVLGRSSGYSRASGFN